MSKFIHKTKIRADDYITGALIISLIIFIVFFSLEALMSMIIYPCVALFFSGIIKIVNGLSKRNRGNSGNLNKVLLGLIFSIFSMGLLNFFIQLPRVSIQNLINISAFPLVVVGIAGIVKGRFISLYSTKWRIINIGIGIITVGFSILALVSSYSIRPNLRIKSLNKDLSLFYIISLSIILLVNVIGRAALYLSEYGLSLLHIRNFKLFFYIISDYSISVNPEGNIILEKMSIK